MKNKLSKLLLIVSMVFTLLPGLSSTQVNAEEKHETQTLSREDIQFNVDVAYTDENNAKIQVEAIPNSEEIQINSIKNPALDIFNLNKTEYTITQNGTYAFWVNYTKNNIEKTEEFYVDAYQLAITLVEGEIPTYENGWVPAGNIDRSKIKMANGDGKPTGDILVKGIPIAVEVDGQLYSPTSKFMVAFMKDEKGNGLMCLDPSKAAAEQVTNYNEPAPYDDSEPVLGKGLITVPAGELSLYWYFGSVYLPRNANELKLSEAEWFLATQLILWDKLGYRYNDGQIPNNISNAITEIKKRVENHKARLTAGNNLNLLTYANETDTVGSWIPFVDGTQLSFSDPLVVKNKEIKVQVPKVLSTDLITGWDTKTPGVSMSYTYGTDTDVFTFKLVGDIEVGRNTVPFSIIPESMQGNPWFLDGSKNGQAFQNLMSFRVPEAKTKKISFLFEPIKIGNPGTPATPPTITPPTFTKVDEEDGSPIQGANFEFRAGENFKMKWLVEKKKLVESVTTPAVPCTNNPDTGSCEGGSPSYSTYTYEIEDPVPATTPAGIYKPVGIFAERDHLFGEWTTDANGKIDLTPIVNDITTAVDTHKTESASQNEPASWGTTETIDDRIPSNELNYYYVDPDYYFENG